MAQHALVWGSSGHVEQDSLVPAQPSHTAFQSYSSQESGKPKSTCLAHSASAFKGQGFSEAVAATRSVYEAKWTIFTRWCITNQVDFRAPPIMSIADFLLYLFQERKLQPSTIEGYRSAIADQLGNSPINVTIKETSLKHLTFKTVFLLTLCSDKCRSESHVSFKKGFDKDISPTTISSWIKQTMILCYERSDQESLTLHKVKPMM